MEINLKDIQYRIGQSGAKGDAGWAMCLIYIDARTATEILDKKYGELGWEFDWEQVPENKWAIRGNMQITKDQKIIKRSDVGYPQQGKKYSEPDQTEWLKDAVSDALKRCAVQFGVGRELYDAPLLFTKEVVVGSNGKVKKLTRIGDQIIQGEINKWYEKSFSSK